MQHYGKRQRLVIIMILLVTYCLCGAGETISISYDQANPMMVFAVKDLTRAFHQGNKQGDQSWGQMDLTIIAPDPTVFFIQCDWPQD